MPGRKHNEQRKKIMINSNHAMVGKKERGTSSPQNGEKR